MPEDAMPGGAPIRVPLPDPEANPGGHLESARPRRVPPTRRGRVPGEPVPSSEPPAAPPRPLGGASRDRPTIAPEAGPTAPVEAGWEALA